MADFECTNRAMALAVLDTIAASLKGMRREAVLAVKDWVQENAPDFSKIAQADYSMLTDKQLKEIIAWESMNGS